MRDDQQHYVLDKDGAPETTEIDTMTEDMSMSIRDNFGSANKNENSSHNMLGSTKKMASGQASKLLSRESSHQKLSVQSTLKRPAQPTAPTL